MKNRFQEALNKNDEKWNQKSHANVCRVVRVYASQGLGGPLKSINPVSPEGPERQPLPLGHSPRAQGGTVADSCSGFKPDSNHGGPWLAMIGAG